MIVFNVIAAVDIWACGVILLSIVSGCFPFFHAPDDITALAEIVTIFGSTKLKHVADVLGSLNYISVLFTFN